MLLPLAGALTVKAKFPRVAERTKPPLDRISNLSLILVIALLTVVNFKSVLEVFGTRGILAGLLLTTRPGETVATHPERSGFTQSDCRRNWPALCWDQQALRCKRECR